MSDSTSRFSDRVDDYVRSRPGYPDAMFDAFTRECDLESGDAVADIGSGTGISTGPLLDRGLVVHAIEPGDAMRRAAEERYGNRAAFHSVAAKAEETGLPDTSVDAAFAAQAFHWFDRRRFARELARILKPEGNFGIAWNERLTGATPFLRDYEELLREHGTDYLAVDHTRLTLDDIREVIPRDFRVFAFPNAQTFDFEGLRSRVRSSSYTPAQGDPGHEPMMKALRTIFEAHADGGFVQFLYETKLYVGRVGAQG